MHSKNKKPMTNAERLHIEKVKSICCVICDAPPPSDCHEPEQGLWFVSVALCRDCHLGSRNGWHGERIMWRVKKMDELKAIAETIERVYG